MSRIPWQVGDRLLGASALPELMGILNCTPDSFFDGGKRTDLSSQLIWAKQMLVEGASIIDIGGESTRPGAASVSADEELRRVIPVIQELKKWQSDFHFQISIDTTKAHVAKEAVLSGATIINDVTMGQSDPQMMETMVHSGASIVLNHIQGTPRDMQIQPNYADCVSEVQNALKQVAIQLEQMGLSRQKICLDPGICFGKRLEDNYELIRSANVFCQMGYPVLYGVSRKSYIGKTPGLETSDRLIPSVVSAVLLARSGVGVLRVHDVAATREGLLISQQL